MSSKMVVLCLIGAALIELVAASVTHNNFYTQQGMLLALIAIAVRLNRRD